MDPQFPRRLWISVSLICLVFIGSGVLFPDQGWNPRPLQWKGRVLTTGAPGKSPSLCFFVPMR